MKPLLAATATEAPDEQLVAAVRDGSDEAFEALFRRYRDRIVGYVRGMVSDHGRAEDIVQEAFLSAHRALHRSDNEIVFRPWIYEIAKNACIDHLRRARRAQEVSIDSDDFSPVDESRLSQASAGTDATVARRHEFDSLRMAFDDLPRSQHQILVMRELEGLSYDSIGNRMGLTRGAVESMLFRARRRLRDGFDEIDTGARCERMRASMEAVAEGSVRARERRRLSSHLNHCKPCRRSAVALGLDSLVLGTPGGRLHRAAALLPLPAFLRRRLDDASLALGPAAQGGVDHGTTLAGKAAALIAAAALAAGGAGVTHKATGGDLLLGGGSGSPPAMDTTSGTGGAGNGSSGAAGGGPGGHDPASQGSANGGGAVPGTGPLGGAPNGQGAVPGTVGGLPAVPGPGGAMGDSGAGNSVGGLGGSSGGDALPGRTVQNLGNGDVGGVVKDVGDTVKQSPGKVKKVVQNAPTSDGTQKVKVKPPKVDVKPPKVKVKVPGGGSVQTGDGSTGGPAVTLPQTQLPGTGPTGLSLPLVGSSTGLGL